MSDEMKPVKCGCGGEAEIFHIAPEGYAGSYCVRCVKCLTQSPFFTGNKDKAIEVWNRAMGATDTNVGDKIIYCKDCKYSHMTIDGLCKYCDIWFPNEKMYEDGKYFCASAEKRML